MLVLEELVEVELEDVLVLVDEELVEVDEEDVLVDVLELDVEVDEVLDVDEVEEEVVVDRSSELYT